MDLFYAEVRDVFNIFTYGLRFIMLLTNLFLLLYNFLQLYIGVSGNTPGRQFGTPLDNIVQLEMVLPTGHHVRFGPTNWTMPIPAGKITPQTTEVLGWCNSKPNEVEVANWEWVECSGKYIPDFDDLLMYE